MHRHIELLKTYKEFLGWSAEYIWEQGFIDQWGRFMTREVALIWAIENGQLNGRCPVLDKLYSENLY